MSLASRWSGEVCKHVALRSWQDDACASSRVVEGSLSRHATPRRTSSSFGFGTMRLRVCREHDSTCAMSTSQVSAASCLVGVQCIEKPPRRSVPRYVHPDAIKQVLKLTALVALSEQTKVVLRQGFVSVDGRSLPEASGLLGEWRCTGLKS